MLRVTLVYNAMIQSEGRIAMAELDLTQMRIDLDNEIQRAIEKEQELERRLKALEDKETTE